MLSTAMPHAPAVSPGKDTLELYARLVALAYGDVAQWEWELDGGAWERLRLLARAERCATLAWARSGDLIRRQVPSDLAADWRASSLDTIARGAVQLRHLVELVRALESAGVRATVLKGIPLSARLYGNPFLRGSTDIDVHVPDHSRARARDVLLQIGWTHRSGEAPMEELYALSPSSGQPGCVLEVHGARATDHLSHLPPIPMQAELMDVNGELLPAHSNPGLAVFLAEHLALHQMPPLLWVLDFTRVLELERDGSAAAMVCAQSVGRERYFTWAVGRSEALRAVARGDQSHAAELGITSGGRSDTHPVWRHLRMAPDARSAARVLSAVLLPHKLRSGGQGARSLVRSTWARLRRRWRSLYRQSRTH